MKTNNFVKNGFHSGQPIANNFHASLVQPLQLACRSIQDRSVLRQLQLQVLLQRVRPQDHRLRQVELEDRYSPEPQPVGRVRQNCSKVSVEDSGDARRDGDQVNPVWIYPFRFAQLN
jgi:hypothetical protein